MTPQPLIDQPALPGHLAPFLEAFQLLNESRPISQGGIGGITTADILALAPEIEPGEPLRFLRVIRAMDALVLDDFSKRVEAAQSA